MSLWQWFNGYDGVEQFLYGTAAVSTLWFGLALALKLKKENWFREYGEALFVAVWLALGIRATLVEVYSIPSESMVPTLLVEDHLVVSKVTFGWHIPFTHGRILEFKKPKRGDVVIFVPPSEPQKNFVKRCIGLPGDVVEVRNKIVFINGAQAEFPTSYGFLQDFPPQAGALLHGAYQQLLAAHAAAWASQRQRLGAAKGYIDANAVMMENQEHSWNGPFDDGLVSYLVGANAFQSIAAARLLDGKKAGSFQTYDKGVKQLGIYAGLGNRDWYGPLTLKPGQYWMMGDDRDNSSDSRFFGPVPEENLRGTPLFRYWPLSRLGLVH